MGKMPRTARQHVASGLSVGFARLMRWQVSRVARRVPAWAR